jgi:hypothetical protein
MDQDYWINDNVHRILGLSDKNIVNYIKACAKKSHNVSQLRSSLEDIDFPSTKENEPFL